MLSRKLNAKTIICLVALLLVLALVGRVTWMWLNDEIVDEREPGTAVSLNVMMPIALIVASSYLWSALVLLRQYLVHGGKAFTLTENGIENTLTFVIIFAFVFVLRVKCIPWDAVTYADAENIYIRAKRKRIRAGFLAKTIVGVKGFLFCHGFCKRKLTRDEFETYVLPRVPEKARN